jgi:hypothetical protein
LLPVIGAYHDDNQRRLHLFHHRGELFRPVVVVLAHDPGRAVAALGDRYAGRLFKGSLQSVCEATGREIADDQDRAGIVEFCNGIRLGRSRRRCRTGG